MSSKRVLREPQGGVRKSRRIDARKRIDDRRATVSSEDVEPCSVLGKEVCLQNDDIMSSSDGKDSDQFLDRFIQSRKDILHRTLPRSGVHSRPVVAASRHNQGSSRNSCFDESLMCAEGQWALRVSNLPADFFTSREAKLLISSSNNRSKKPLVYKGMILDDIVLSDLRSYFESQVEPFVFRSQCLSSYKLLKTCLGQLLRYACAVGRSDSLALHKPGEMFKVSSDEKVLRAFILGIQTRCTATTVCSKASALLKWVKFSGIWYSKGDNRSERGKCDASAEYLRSTAAAEKREARRSSRSLKSPFERLSANHVLLAEDFSRAQAKAENSLRSIFATAQSAFSQRRVNDVGGQKEVMYEILADKHGGLMRKWCINFLNLIVLHGGGQRAQVYAEMQRDAFAIGRNGNLVDRVPELRRIAQETGYFYLQTSFEKRQRSQKMPYIRLPVSILDLYLTHCFLCRPAVLKRAGKSDLEGSPALLLLNSEKGCPLTAKQVSSSVKSFFTYMDAELGPITPLVIRKSFASIMYKRYLNGEIHQDKSRSQFLEFLAERLNTSLEQLEESYCAEETAEEAVSRIFAE